MRISVQDIADRIGAPVRGDKDRILTGVAPFTDAGPEDLCFAEAPALLNRLAGCRAGAILVPGTFQAPETAPFPSSLVLCSAPKSQFFQLLAWLYPVPPRSPSFSPRSVTGQDFTAGDDLVVAPHVTIGDHVSLGRGVHIMAGVYIGDHVRIGDDTEIRPNVTIMDRSCIGSRVLIHPNTVIGSDGFGFTPAGQGHEKVPHRGWVEIGDDVEIGAGNTIDRGTLGRTFLGPGVKTDNQVHIAHNVSIGAHTLVVAQVGIAGSTTIGRNVIIAGKAGISGHLHVGDGAIVGPGAGVAKDVKAGDIVSGVPDMPHKCWLKVGTILPRLPEMRRLLLGLEKKVKQIEKRFETE